MMSRKATKSELASVREQIVPKIIPLDRIEPPGL